MSERIAYQFNGDHVLKFAGMQKLTGEQVADELNRLYTIIAEKNEQIAEPEQKAEPWIPVSEQLLDAYAQISKGAERMSNRDCKHGQLARSCDLCDLEQEVNEQAETIAAQQQVLNGLAEMLGVEAGDVDGLITRVEWVRKDAERYQWLKNRRMFRMLSADMSGKHTYTTVGRPIGSGKNIDEAIDAARGKGESHDNRD